MVTPIRQFGTAIRCKIKVKLVFKHFDNSFLGVFIWANGDRARVTFDQDNLIFDHRILFPDNDFRMEYRGEIKDDRKPHGEGTLILKDGVTSFSGKWVDGTCDKYNLEILGIKKAFQTGILM